MRVKFFHTMKHFVFALAIGMALTSFAAAQEITGAIVGTVRDANGAVIPGATVTLIDSDKANLVVRTTTTSDNGEFVFAPIQVSTYSISVEASGFKKGVKSGVKVDVGQRRSVDVSLEAGNIQETVTVEADAVAIDKDSVTVGTTISGDQVRELSVNNRNFTQLVVLAPGVTNDLSDQVYVGTTNPEGQANTVQIAVNGARSSQNTFTVDGADITDRGSNLTIQAYPSVDSIGEFKVLRSLYPAESGRSGGGQVNIVTRSGGSKLRGSAYYFMRDEAFDANQVLINNITGTPPFGRDENGKARRAPFTYRNYGWTFGGPLYFFKFGERDPDEGMFAKYSKTFFFFSQEFRRDTRQTSATTVSVPTQAMRAGVFPIPVCVNRTFLAEACTAANVLSANTPLPGSRYSQAALGYVNGIYNRLPLPNAPTATNPFALVTTLENLFKFRQEVFKLDHKFSDNLSAYYRFQNDTIPTVEGNALFSSGSSLPGVSTTSTNSPGRTHTVQATWAASQNKIIEGRYVYSYGAILSENIGLLALTNTRVPVNLPFTNQRDRVPTLTGNGVTGLTSFGPYDNFSNKHNYSGSFTWIKNSHNLKFGAIYSLYRKNENALAGNNEGNFGGFAATLVTAANLPAGQTLPANTALNQNYQRWANFLVGNAGTFSQASFDYTADLRQKNFEAFAQDEWKLRRNMTLYLGVRYSFFGAPWDKNGRLTNFIPELFSGANTPQVTGAGNRISGVAGVSTGNWCNGIIVNTQNIITPPATFNCNATASPYGKFVVDAGKKDFAPRIGLAWDPFSKGKTAVRAGYGIYHEQILNGIYLQMIGLNPPYQVTATATNTSLDNPATGIAINAAVPGLRAVQHNWETPYMQHWSLDFQQQLLKNTTVTVGYYGSKGTNLIGLTELNSLRARQALGSTCAAGNTYFAQPTAPTLVPCQLPGYAFRGSATTAAQGNTNVVGATAFNDTLILDQLRPYKGFRSIAIVQPRYDSNYHSLQIAGTHRFKGASQVNVAYTWGKNLTTSINDRTTSPQDTYNIELEYQRAALDRRHVLSVNYVYELPFFDKQKGFVGKVLGGWQASGIITLNTGLPFTAVTSNFDPAGLGIILANPAGRPNLLCDPNQGGAQTVQQWFNTACFQLNPGLTNPDGSRLLVPNTVGNTARGNIQGPGTQRVDFSMFKNLRFSERVRFQFRAEAFNIFNRTNLRTFSSTNVTSTLFGVIGGFRDSRKMQFGIKANF